MWRGEGGGEGGLYVCVCGGVAVCVCVGGSVGNFFSVVWYMIRPLFFQQNVYD